MESLIVGLTNVRLFGCVCLILAGTGFSRLFAQSGYDKPGKTDTFHAGPEVYHVQHGSSDKGAYHSTDRESYHGGPTARLSRGEIVQVMSCPRNARPPLAFYLPPEATSIVQLVVEKRSAEVNYFVKGLSSGHTVGGAVERNWLDWGGFHPRNMADEARIQAAVKRNPLYIEVR